jgi:adenylate cyclase
MSRPPWRSVLFVSSVTTIAIAYLFVQAPPPLAAAPEDRATVPIRSVFALLEHENDVARELWTSRIVKAGTARGLAFGENWRDETAGKGPLPALFLRETARHLEREAPGLRLFLGSQYPINTANHFTGGQAAYFRRLLDTEAPQQFYESATGLHTAMFADRAVVDACVRCHNEHPDSPKTDWRSGDIMGATTWMYPDATVTTQRAVELIAALRRSIRAAYASYLARAATISDPPVVGDGWPEDGRRLPTEEVFMAELARRSSTATLDGLIDPALADQLAAATPPPPPVVPVVVPPAPPPAPAPPPPSAQPEDLLVIRARRSTKVIVERDGSQLLVARLRAGRLASVSSPPPLQVHVADADALVVEYRGKPINPPEVEVVVAEDD